MVDLVLEEANIYIYIYIAQIVEEEKVEKV